MLPDELNIFLAEFLEPQYHHIIIHPRELPSVIIRYWMLGKTTSLVNTVLLCSRL